MHLLLGWFQHAVTTEVHVQHVQPDSIGASPHVRQRDTAHLHASSPLEEVSQAQGTPSPGQAPGNAQLFQPSLGREL